MSISDYQTEFDPPSTPITATGYSVNKLKNPSNGDITLNTIPIYLQVVADATFVSGGSTTLVVTLETASDEAFTSPVTLMTTATIAKASLVNGYEIINQIVPHGAKKYLRVKYTVATGPFTAGSVTARLMSNSGSRTNYPQ
ncbi:major capsid protein [Caudoviricetes sp.]|nr:major capsid protein [Caudoviricetes sp.]